MIEKGMRSLVYMYKCLDCATYSHIHLGGWQGVRCLITRGNDALPYSRCRYPMLSICPRYYLVIWQEHLLSPVYK